MELKLCSLHCNGASEQVGQGAERSKHFSSVRSIVPFVPFVPILYHFGVLNVFLKVEVGMFEAVRGGLI
jgi:hypothetical protein